MGQAQQKRRAVLIVEDDAELRSLTAALLQDEQMDTIECESALVNSALRKRFARQARKSLRPLHTRQPSCHGVNFPWRLLPVFARLPGAGRHQPRPDC